MVGQSKVRVCLNAFTPEPSDDILQMCNLTPSNCFKTIAVSLAIDPNKIPSLFSIIEYEGHHHPLYFINKQFSDELDECNAYDSYCKQLVVSDSDELNRTTSFIFHCKKCDFNVHLLCGPLPSTIEYKFHRHRLTLVDSFLEDDSGGYCCDVCEERRDPRICVYLCADCRYVSHVHCLISEVSHVFNGDYGDVNLRIINEQRLSTSQNDTLEIQELKVSSKDYYLTLSQMILNLKEEEQGLLAQHFEADNNKSIIGSKSTILLQDSFYSDVFYDNEEEESQDVDCSDFRRMVTRVKWFFEQKRLQLSSKNLDVKVVKIVDYMVPWTLAPILGMLIQCGLEEQVRPSTSDFRQLTPEMKGLSYTFLCQLISSMSRTRVGNVSEELLTDWYCHAMFLKRLGFRISFVFERLRQITLAHFGLQVSRFESETPKTLTREIEKGKQEIIELEEKLAKLKEKIVEQEAELKRYKSSPKSNFANKCFKEASVLEWKSAGDDLFKI